MLHEFIKKLAFFIGILIYFSEGVNYAQHAPFFPNMAKEKGSSVLWVGFISSGFDFTAIVLAVILPLIFNYKKVTLGFLLGSFSAGTACLLFAFTELISDLCLFNVSCWLIRAVFGAASSCVWGFGIPLFTEMYPEHASMIIGVIEGVYALGLMTGPAVGSLLYSLGGFQLPFLASGVFQIFLVALLTSLLPHTRNLDRTDVNSVSELTKIHQLNDDEGANTCNKEHNFIKFISRPGMVCGTLSYAMSCSIIGHIDVSVAPILLETYGIDGGKSGFVFLTYAFAYTLGCPMVSILVSKGYASYLYIISPLLTAVVFSILFVPEYVSQVAHIQILMVSLVLLGALFAMASVPVLLIAGKISLLYGFTDLKAIKLYTANLWNLVFLSGRLIGSCIVGGAVADVVGFYWTNFIIASIMLFSGLITFVTLLRFDLLKYIFYSID